MPCFNRKILFPILVCDKEQKARFKREDCRHARKIQKLCYASCHKNIISFKDYYLRSQLAVIRTRAMLGVQAPEVLAEIHLSFGLPGFNIVGLPETTVKESKDRVRSAIINSQFDFPDKKIVVNLSPADLPKQGSRFDLAIAIGILVASGQIKTENINTLEFIGELALTGELRRVTGLLPFAIQTQATKRTLIFPKENTTDILFLKNLPYLAANSLLEICEALHNPNQLFEKTRGLDKNKITHIFPDYAEVKGQFHAKKGLEIAAAGGHHLLMVGSPGSGKTMLATRFISILPDLSYTAAMETAAIYGLTDVQRESLFSPPFRMPHHTSSHVALVGGGRPPKPGEISLSHHGILFLDELTEFSKHSLETLRQPLESGQVCISRAGYQAEFPAQFQLISAMNPCPCGYYGDPERHCRCTPEQIRRYQNKLSGPLLERIDIRLTVNAVPKTEWFKQESSENSQKIKERVLQARTIQLNRQGQLNAALNTEGLKKHCVISPAVQNIIETAIQEYQLSMRGVHRLIKVARTIADLQSSLTINLAHFSDALLLHTDLRSLV